MHLLVAVLLGCTEQLEQHTRMDGDAILLFDMLLRKYPSLERTRCAQVGSRLAKSAGCGACAHTTRTEQWSRRRVELRLDWSGKSTSEWRTALQLLAFRKFKMQMYLGVQGIIRRMLQGTDTMTEERTTVNNNRTLDFVSIQTSDSKH